MEHLPRGSNNEPECYLCLRSNGYRSPRPFTARMTLSQPAAYEIRARTFEWSEGDRNRWMEQASKARYVARKLLDALIIEYHVQCDRIWAHILDGPAAETTLKADIGFAGGHNRDAGIAI
jgi:hypothetical protein